MGGSGGPGRFLASRSGRLWESGQSWTRVDSSEEGECSLRPGRSVPRRTYGSIFAAAPDLSRKRRHLGKESAWRTPQEAQRGNPFAAALPAQLASLLKNNGVLFILLASRAGCPFAGGVSSLAKQGVQTRRK